MGVFLICLLATDDWIAASSESGDAISYLSESLVSAPGNITVPLLPGISAL